MTSASFFDSESTYHPRDLTPEEERKAALFVCSRAKDVEEATQILQMLGILPSPAPVETRRDYYGRWV